MNIPLRPAQTLDQLLAEARSCRACAAHLPLGPRPILQAAATARILVVGQAPGTRAHASGIPWNDRSGERLRDWMGIDAATFHDAHRIAIVPPGRHAQAHVLGAAAAGSVTAAVSGWRAHAPTIVPLPHPSPRNIAWFQVNPWFEAELVPELRRQVARLTTTGLDA